MIDTVFIHCDEGTICEPFHKDDAKEFLKDLLHYNLCKITFTKADGSNRVMIASLLPEFVDPIRPVEKTIEEGAIPKEPKPDNPNLLILVDTEINAWRSIKINSITRFEVLGD